MSRFFLAEDTFLCTVSGYLVFLDLRKNSYSALPPNRENMCAELVELLAGCQETNEHALLEIANDLVEQGLLVSDSTAGKRFVALDYPMPSGSIRIENRTDSSKISSYRLRLFVAWLRVEFMLRFFPLRTIVRQIGRRKALRLRKRESAAQMDILKLATICSEIRTSDFSAKDACLRHSLTMVEFLAQFDLYPDLIFGVQIQPFSAHCWVQHGTTVLNDSAYKVREFTPAMIV